MHKEYEQPLLIDVQKNIPEGVEAKALGEDIRRLCISQPFAVLATQGKAITNASLISFAVSLDLKYLVFATPINSGKFELIAMDENVSILVDDRTLQQDNINQISALTIRGKGKILTDKIERLKWTELLTEKHPNLETFVIAPTSAIILVEVIKYHYVKKFQEVWDWDPNGEVKYEVERKI